MWEQEENAVLDREKTPDFAEKSAAMRADVVVDLSSFRLADTKAMAEALQKAGCAEHMYKFFGRKPDIGFLPWDEWCAYTGDPAETDDTRHHIARRGYFDLEMEKRLLGFEPKCTAPETSGIAVQSYIGRGLIRV